MENIPNSQLTCAFSACYLFKMNKGDVVVITTWKSLLCYSLRGAYKQNARKRWHIPDPESSVLL